MYFVFINNEFNVHQLYNNIGFIAVVWLAKKIYRRFCRNLSTFRYRFAFRCGPMYVCMTWQLCKIDIDNILLYPRVYIIVHRCLWHSECLKVYTTRIVEIDFPDGIYVLPPALAGSCSRTGTTRFDVLTGIANVISNASISLRRVRE